MGYQVKLKTGDLYPPVKGEVESDETGDPIAITSAAVTFYMNDVNGSIIVQALADIDDAAAGQFSYTWQDGDTDNAGHFYAEFKITLSATQILTVPQGEDFIDVVIGDDIAE
jgi:hypothetical protein